MKNGISIPGKVKVALVVLTVAFVVYMIYIGNWFQGIVILNMVLRYRDFAIFFTDFSDETVGLSEKFYERFVNGSNVSANAKISDTYNNLFHGEVEKNLQYSSFYENNANMQKTLHPSNTILTDNKDTHPVLYNQPDVKKKEIPQHSNYGEVHPAVLNDFDSFSNVHYQQNKKIYDRSKGPRANDDIKLLSNFDFNSKVPWWQISQELDFY